jgi:DNA repair exonuclease SbcCD ATPase subunit/DNA repair exonuclease SbcCD nuclease subunit
MKRQHRPSRRPSRRSVPTAAAVVDRRTISRGGLIRLIMVFLLLLAASTRRVGAWTTRRGVHPRIGRHVGTFGAESPARRSWLPRQAHNRNRNDNNSPSSEHTNVTDSTFTSRRVAWRTGQAVWIVLHSSSNNNKGDPHPTTASAVLREDRGRGWWTVETEDGTQLKVRSTQFTKRVEGSKEANVWESSTSTRIRDYTASTTVASTEDAALPERHFSAFSTPSDLVTVTPPPPMIHDVDAVLHAMEDGTDVVQDPAAQEYLQQVAHHANFCRQWVVFTDLHCSSSTLATSLQVLKAVHAAALARPRTGVAFLGDFWHQRGTLRVDCLNAVLQELQSWSVPMVMIPGNHDQVTLGGHAHGLTALQNAYRVDTDSDATEQQSSVPGPLIFSYPTLFGGALWIPHVREHGVMESILQSPAAQQATAVLVHADVTGASMNDLLVSTGGVPPRFFPPNKPIYSGHFHKPHRVTQSLSPSLNNGGDSVQIEYFGSPYEVSLSEAEQPKALVVLDADTWQVVERIPLDLGRHHFRPPSIADFMKLLPEGQNMEEVEGESKLKRVRGGDRVVLSLDKYDLDRLRRAVAPGEETNVDAHAKRLRQAGLSVEIRETTALTDVDWWARQQPHVEELSATSTWDTFLKTEVERGNLNDEQRDHLQAAGLEILDELQAKETALSNGIFKGSQLEFKALTIEGFGPFSKAVEYPLEQRGLVLVRGTNRDHGSDSNGTGKSSLAMATLWALTGSLDPRPLPDGKVADVVHDGSKVARVSVVGTINDHDFCLTRSKTSTRGGLTFVVDGEDMTTQSVKETQAIVDETLGVSPTILARSVFFGQHPLNDLLDSSDTRFKEELAILVPLDTWQEALVVSRKRARESDRRVAELDGMLSIRQEDLAKLCSRISEAKDRYEKAKVQYERVVESLTIELDQYREALDYQGTSMDATDAHLDEVLKLLADSERTRQELEAERAIAESKLSTALKDAKEALAVATQHVAANQQRLDVAVLQVRVSEQAVQKIEAEWNIDLQQGLPSPLLLSQVCPTCGQSMSEEGGAHANTQLHDTIRTSLEALASFKVEQAAASSVFGETQDIYAQRVFAVTQSEEALSEAVNSWNERSRLVDGKIRDARQQQEQLTSNLASSARQQHKYIKANAIQEKLDLEHAALQRTEEWSAAVVEEQRQCQETIDTLRKSQDEVAADVSLMKELSSAFGQRGIQVFVLQNALQSLQSVSQSYLDDLSETSLELKLSLDDGDRIMRQASVGSSGEKKQERSMSSLSGGQWRRCSLALQFGFAELLSRRGSLSSELLILDEPLTHLDQSGRSAFGRVLRRLLRGDRSTILLILQDLAAEELEEAFDAVDEVFKSKGRSRVIVDDGTG